MKSIYVERTKSNAVAQSHRKKSHAVQKHKDKNKVKTKTKMLGAVRIVSVFKHNVYLSLGNLEWIHMQQILNRITVTIKMILYTLQKYSLFLS